jgi:hypothetical protein
MRRADTNLDTNSSFSNTSPVETLNMSSSFLISFTRIDRISSFSASSSTWASESATTTLSSPLLDVVVDDACSRKNVAVVVGILGTIDDVDDFFMGILRNGEELNASVEIVIMIPKAKDNVINPFFEQNHVDRRRFFETALPQQRFFITMIRIVFSLLNLFNTVGP